MSTRRRGRAGAGVAGRRRRAKRAAAAAAAAARTPGGATSSRSSRSSSRSSRSSTSSRRRSTRDHVARRREPDPDARHAPQLQPTSAQHVKAEHRSDVRRAATCAGSSTRCIVAASHGDPHGDARRARRVRVQPLPLQGPADGDAGAAADPDVPAVRSRVAAIYLIVLQRRRRLPADRPEHADRG